MKRLTLTRAAVALAVFLGLVYLGSQTFAQESRRQPPELSAADLEKITAAVPKEAVKPQSPRKILVFWRCEGFFHGSGIAGGNKALALMGEKTGAFTAVESDDIDMFTPEKLAGFDAVCLMSCTGELFWPANFEQLPAAEQEAARRRDEALKKSLLDFVSGGKGLIGSHAATDCFYKWPEYGEMLGGYFDGHPWNEQVMVRLDEPNHPLNAAFGGKPFVIADEIYQFGAPYSRDKLRVLLSLEPTKIDPAKPGIKRTDDDFAISWVRQYGKGRVFYCSLGHRDEIFWNPQVLAHYLAGVQFALGDLSADAEPVPHTTGESPLGVITLFNGKDLSGWICKPGSWAAEDGVLACRAAAISGPNNSSATSFWTSSSRLIKAPTAASSFARPT